MFVEIARLLIVFLFTAAGFELAKGGATAPAEGSAVLGATLGACIGYVAGGIVGRLLNRTMGKNLTRMDIMMAFGEKSYMLAEVESDAAGKWVVKKGWQQDEGVREYLELKGYVPAATQASTSPALK